MAMNWNMPERRVMATMIIMPVSSPMVLKSMPWIAASWVNTPVRIIRPAARWNEAPLRTKSHSAPAWTEEAARMCFLYVVAFGAGLAVREGAFVKVDVIQRALDLHSTAIRSPLDVLRCVGGFEIAAMCGAYLACAQRGLPVVVDGFIATAAALVAAIAAAAWSCVE